MESSSIRGAASGASADRAAIPSAIPPADSLGDSDLSRDPIVRGRVSLWQPRIGYRFSIDPILLASFVGNGPLGTIADIGAGVGVVGLLLGQADASARVTLVELQPRLATLCQRNAAENGMADRTNVVQGDVRSAGLRQALAGASFDVVASCPPYYPLGQGGVNPTDEEAIARHEVHLPLADLVRAARRMLRFRGRFAVVYPTPRLPELLSVLCAEGLNPTRLRIVHPYAGEPGQRVLVEGCKGSKSSLVIEPPLYLRTRATPSQGGGGDYTEEARRILGDLSATDR